MGVGVLRTFYTQTRNRIHPDTRATVCRIRHTLVACVGHSFVSSKLPVFADMSGVVDEYQRHSLCVLRERTIDYQLPHPKMVQRPMLE